jgi:hypothetical protein
LLGRIFGIPSPSPARSTLKSAEPKSRIKDDSRFRPPASDAVARRRIEREIRDALGDRLRSLEVRVSGRNVLIVAKANRFWQKRAVRQALETLPGLAGYRARVEIGD